MLVRQFTFWTVEDHNGTYPQTLKNLTEKIRKLRNESGLSESKTLGNEHVKCITPTVPYLDHQAYLVNHRLAFILDGKPVPTAREVAHKIRKKAAKHYLSDDEVVYASGLRPQEARAYMAGFLPKKINLYHLAILAETLDMNLQYVLEPLNPLVPHEQLPS